MVLSVEVLVAGYAPRTPLFSLLSVIAKTLHAQNLLVIHTIRILENRLIPLEPSGDPDPDRIGIELWSSRSGSHPA